METPQALSKTIHTTSIKLGVHKIDVHFSGGSDEGYCNVDLVLNDGITWSDEHDALQNDIESWATDAYCYGGAGDGSDYGDDISYDLKTNKVTTSDWFTSRVEGDTQDATLEVETD